MHKLNGFDIITGLFLRTALTVVLLMVGVVATPAFAQRMLASISFRYACNAVPVGFARCDAIQVVNSSPATAGPAGYNPSDLQSAYKLPSSTAGSGQTVAIVDAYDDPNAETDLAVYRSQFGLPACTTANGCFRKVDQSGGTSYPQANSGWAEEISLDLDMVSATCPRCHILLVEASAAANLDLAESVDTAVKLGANAVSNSYGSDEAGNGLTYASYYNHPGVIITASAGDSGYGVQIPAVYSTVVSIGGTSLSRASNARGWSETAWSGAGSGCSATVPKPNWQKDSGCSKRTVSDVSAVSDPGTGVSVYDTYDQGTGWMIFGGTSVASPIIAGVYALAGNASNINAASSLYSHADQLNDITSGSNGNCDEGYLCTAGPGYDGPTGLGTPNGTGAF